VKSPLAIKRDNWFKSNEGRKCLNKSSLLCDKDSKYLKNRLELAFLAGATANTEVLEELEVRLKSMILNGM